MSVLYSRSHVLIGRLAQFYGGSVLVIGLLLAVSLWPFGKLGLMTALSVEACQSGFGGIVLPILVLAFTALLALMTMTGARYRSSSASATPASKTTWVDVAKHWFVMTPGPAARGGQGAIWSAGTLVLWALAWLLWPPAVAPQLQPVAANILTAIAFSLAFLMLITERLLSNVPSPQLPEVPALRRLLLLATVTMGVAGCLEIGRSAGIEVLAWPTMAIALIAPLVAGELAGRALGRFFMPLPPAAEARAVAESILVTLVTGGPRASKALITVHLGLDFARSWAFAYLSKAIVPALSLSALFCWGLSGLQLIDLGQRGVYERLGAPVAVLKPGLHLLLPWPLGRLRSVEYGTLHDIAVGTDQQLEAVEQLGAETVPPASLNRLWDTAYPTESEYLVASQSGGQQGFQALSAEIHVLYRTGLSDSDALQAVYGATEQGSLVKNEANRLVTRYFAARTLESVLGARRESLAEALRSELTQAVQEDKAGVEIVAVLIEAIHPPSGAAAAYHQVQAAEIRADASISEETGRAERMIGASQEEALQLTDAAEASADEKIQGATGDAFRFSTDRQAYQNAPQAFLLERADSNIVNALTPTSLTLIDHRLAPGKGPTIDLRAFGLTASGAGLSGETASGAGGVPALVPHEEAPD